MDLIFPLLILFMIGLLFMSSRTRKKQQKEHDALTNSLAVGDVVVMTSGISGTVVDVDDERTIDLEIAPDVITTWLRVAVREKLTDGGASGEGFEDTATTDAPVPGDDAIGGTPAGASGPSLQKGTDEKSEAPGPSRSS